MARVGVGVAVGRTAGGGLAGHDHPGDRPVTGQSSTRLRFQGPEPTQIPTHGAGTAEQAVQVHDHAQLGPDPTRHRQPAAFQGPAGQLTQGVGGALAAAAGVAGIGGTSQRLDGRPQGLAGLGSNRPLTATS